MQLSTNQESIQELMQQVKKDNEDILKLNQDIMELNRVNERFKQDNADLKDK